MQETLKYYEIWPWYSIAARPWKWSLRSFMVYPELHDEVINNLKAIYGK